MFPTGRKKTSGIYKIVNKTNGKFYVGSAVHLAHRKAMHLSDLRKRSHGNAILQRAWQKYKENSFEFVCIEFVNDETKLIEREQHWIDTLKPEYNICKIAGSSLGVKRSKEFKENSSKSRRGVKWKGPRKFYYNLPGCSHALKGRPSPLKGRKRPDISKDVTRIWKSRKISLLLNILNSIVMSKGKLVTTDTPEAGSGGAKKTIQPGNVVVKINDITFDKTNFKTEDSWNVNLHMETEPIKDFDGFWLDNNDHEKGKFLGQVAKVRATEYPLKDGAINGTPIFRDKDALKLIKNLLTATGMPMVTDAQTKISNPQWLVDQDAKHDNIESLLDQLRKDNPFKGLWFNACLAGKVYINQGGFAAYDMYLPRFTAAQVPLERVGTTPSKMIIFNQDLHIKRSKPKTGATATAESKGADWEL